MNRVLITFVFALGFILAGCSDFKKVDLSEYHINLDLKRDMEISKDGMKSQQYLKQVSINDFEMNVEGGTVKLLPNKKNHVEILGLGEIIIRIKEDGRQISGIDLWMTERQLQQIE